MRFGVVGDLVALAGLQGEGATVFQFGQQLALHAKQDMAFDAPMIGQVPRCVFDHADPDGAEVLGPPIGHAGVAGMLGRRVSGSIGGAEGNVGHLHGRGLRRSS